MRKALLCLLLATFTQNLNAAPKPPPPHDLFGWELPGLVSFDSIEFPRRLIRNRSYGRVVAEIHLHRDGEQIEIDFTHIENGDLTRWAEKILKSARFTPAKLDGSPVASRVPVHVVFYAKDDTRKERIEIWYPSDSSTYQAALIEHFLLINESLAPLLIRVGSYDWVEEKSAPGGMVIFEVYVHKDGAREEGRLIYSPGDVFTRQALASVLEMQILPSRYRRQGYGCWTRVLVGFTPEWTFPTLPVDRALQPYRGWPAPVVAAVGAAPFVPPLLKSIDLDSSVYNRALLSRAAELVHGLPLYNVLVDTSGRVVSWFKARDVESDKLATDWEYLSWGTDFLQRESASLGAMSLPELARLSADELESILPYLRFSPGRDATGNRVDMWIALTPALLR
jgi:hypothetical protein